MNAKTQALWLEKGCRTLEERVAYCRKVRESYEPGNNQLEKLDTQIREMEDDN